MPLRNGAAQKRVAIRSIVSRQVAAIEPVRVVRGTIGDGCRVQCRVPKVEQQTQHLTCVNGSQIKNKELSW